MTKRKADDPQTEVELTPESRELLEGFTQEGIETGVVAGGFAPAEPGSGGWRLPCSRACWRAFVRRARSCAASGRRRAATTLMVLSALILRTSGSERLSLGGPWACTRCDLAFA